MKKKRVKLTVLLAVLIVVTGMFYTKADDLLRAEQVRLDAAETEKSAATVPSEDDQAESADKKEGEAAASDVRERDTSGGSTEEGSPEPATNGTEEGSPEPAASGTEEGSPEPAVSGMEEDSLDNGASGSDSDIGGVDGTTDDAWADIGSYYPDVNGAGQPAVTSEGKIGYILIGDSRFVGMNMAVDVNSQENRFLIAKNGAGYDFLVYTALPQAARIEKQHPKIDSWVYIINLGVNDLRYAWKYAMAYRDLLKSKHLVIESVNPMDYSVAPPSSQKEIEAFNERMKMIDGVEYLDTYQSLMKNGFSTTDGVHYTTETYTYIYSCIEEYIRKSEGQ